MDSYTLVTGASGFVGSNIVKCLAEKGESVLATTRNPEGPDPLIRHYLRELEDQIEWKTVDLTDTTGVMKLGDNNRITGIIHAAIFTAVSKNVEQERSREILESNLLGTINVLELAKKSKTNQMVYVSSSGLYGSTDDSSKPVPESSTDPYLKMSGFYHITKICSEKLTERYSQLFPIKTTSMRIAAPYGNMERPTGSRYLMGPIYRLLYQIITEKKKHLRVKGLDYVRDWTFVEDTARCLILGLEAESPSTLYNVSCGINYSLREILDAIQDVPEIDFTWEEVEKDEDAEFLVQVGSLRGPLSIEKAKSELGFKPKYDIKKGVKAYCDWWIDVTNEGLFP